MNASVELRPVRESEVAGLLRLLWDPSVTGEHQWFGYRMARVAELERRWRDDGLIGATSSFLTVSVEDGTCVGWVTWRPEETTGSVEIGAALFPDHRGRGIGTEAQRQLVDYLFSTTSVHRIQAGTEIGNVAEQVALEKVGFQREGVQRGLYFRDGEWRDSVMYSLLRSDRS